MPHDNADSGPGSESGMPFPQRFREVGSTLKRLGPKEVTLRSNVVSFFVTTDSTDLAVTFGLENRVHLFLRQNGVVFCKAELFIFYKENLSTRSLSCIPFLTSSRHYIPFIYA